MRDSEAVAGGQWGPSCKYWSGLALISCRYVICAFRREGKIPLFFITGSSAIKNFFVDVVWQILIGNACVVKIENQNINGQKKNPKLLSIHLAAEGFGDFVYDFFKFSMFFIRVPESWVNPW